MTGSATIERLSAGQVEAELDDLAVLLAACVEGGASVNFVLPYGPDDGARFWRERVLPAMGTGGLVVFAARVDGRIAGSVQLAHAPQPNQPHRADVAKLLVHPARRRLGLGRRLMQALIAEADSRGRRLLTLDTTSGSPAQALYASLGFVVAGEIPDYSLDVTSKRLEPTTLMYRQG